MGPLYATTCATDAEGPQIQLCDDLSSQWDMGSLCFDIKVDENCTCFMVVHIADVHFTQLALPRMVPSSTSRETKNVQTRLANYQ